MRSSRRLKEWSAPRQLRRSTSFKADGTAFEQSGTPGTDLAQTALALLISISSMKYDERPKRIWETLRSLQDAELDFRWVSRHMKRLKEDPANILGLYQDPDIEIVQVSDGNTQEHMSVTSDDDTDDYDPGMQSALIAAATGANMTNGAKTRSTTPILSAEKLNNLSVAARHLYCALSVLDCK